jgi:hypothetical protein
LLRLLKENKQTRGRHAIVSWEIGYSNGLDNILLCQTLIISYLRAKLYEKFLKISCQEVTENMLYFMPERQSFSRSLIFARAGGLDACFWG